MARVIAETLGCDDQTIRNVIHTFNTTGLTALPPRSFAPPAHPADRLRCPPLRTVAGPAAPAPARLWSTHQSVDLTPRSRGRVCRRPHAPAGQRRDDPVGPRLPRGPLEAVKHWMTSPDPAYARKKTPRPPDPAGPCASHVGAWLRRCGLVELAGPTRPAWLGRRRGEHPPPDPSGASKKFLYICLACGNSESTSPETKCPRIYLKDH